MPDIRKLVYLREESFAEAGRVAPRPIIRAVALILIGNPFAGRFEEDLSPLVDYGPQLSAQIAPELVKLLRGPVVSYGKGAIVGAAGELEHAAAILHPALGRPLREAIGGGAAIIPSAAKMGGPGSALDLPLGHKDDVWSRGHFDAITVSLGDGPRPDEILAVIGLADGGRLLHRIGEGAPR
ncbi:MAG: amino acid synthesis family protein [Alphaproteobacteria bacterium]|jgi:hypothetical protein